jgi:hypothetical protein
MAITATTAEIEALRKAYVSGVLRVRHGDVETQYGSREDLLARLNQLLNQENASNVGPKAGFSSFDRGDD